SIELPTEIMTMAPAVHVPAAREIVWRLTATKDGAYEIKVAGAGKSVTKTLYVSTELARVSPVRLRGHFWERMFISTESAIPENSPVESITINYPERTIDIAGYEINWIWLFFI